MSGVLHLFNGYGRVVRVSTKKKELYQIAVKYVDLKIPRRDAKSLNPIKKRKVAKKI